MQPIGINCAEPVYICVCSYFNMGIFTSMIQWCLINLLIILFPEFIYFDSNSTCFFFLGMFCLSIKGVSSLLKIVVVYIFAYLIFSPHSNECEHASYEAGHLKNPSNSFQVGGLLSSSVRPPQIDLSYLLHIKQLKVKLQPLDCIHFVLHT